MYFFYLEIKKNVTEKIKFDFLVKKYICMFPFLKTFTENWRFYFYLGFVIFIIFFTSQKMQE